MNHFGALFFPFLLTFYQLVFKCCPHRIKSKALFCLLFLMCGTNAFSQKTITITDTFQCKYLGEYSYLLEDANHQISLQNLLTKPLEEWENSKLEKPRKGVSTSTFWSRTTIENRTDEIQEMTIVLEYPMVDWVQFFIVANDTTILDQSKAMGDVQPFANRTVQHHYFVYNYTFLPKSTYTFYCKSGQLGGKFYLPLHLFKHNVWLSKNNKDLLRHGLILGLVSILCLISFITFLRTRKVFLLFFTLQNLSLAFFYLAFNGLGFQYIWAFEIPYQQIGTVQAMNALTIFRVLFLITFFNIKQIRSIYRIFIFILGVQLVCFILPILIVYIPLFNTPTLAKVSRLLNFSITALILFILFTLSCLYYQKTKDHQMKWYLLLLSFQIVIGLIGFIPYFTNIDFGNLTTANVSILSSLLEGFVLAIIIINYFKDTFFEKEQLAFIVAQKQSEAYQNLLLGQEEERKRLSQELHDGLSVRLNLLKQNLGKKQYIDESNQTTILADLDTIHQDLRNFSHALNPTILKQLGFKKAVHDLIFKIEMSHLNLDIQFDCPNNIADFDKEKEKHLYHILQELLNNTIKYAQASKVNIEFKIKNNQQNFIYMDNGIGYEVTQNNVRGIGLKNIAARVAILNGQLAIHRREPSGMLYSITL